MASIIIVWDKRAAIPGGPSSKPGESNVLRVTCDGTTSLSALVTKILNAAGKDKIEVLRIFAHGGSSQGGEVALTKDRLNKNNLAAFATPLAGHFTEEGRIEIHSCLVGKNGTTVSSDSWIFLSYLAIAAKAFVYAAEEIQMVWTAEPWDPHWEGNVLIFPPTGA